MVYSASEKYRKKIFKLVELKKQENPDTDEAVLKKQVLKELKAERKKNKKAEHAEVEKIVEEIEKKMENSNRKDIEKAKTKAEAKHFSKIKKAKRKTSLAKKQADEIVVSKHCDLWCPKNENWFDEECIKKFNELWFLAAMFQINLDRSAQNLQEIVPEICKEYFDFLAKKRFNLDQDKENSTSKSKKPKSKKSKIEKKFETVKADNIDGKSDKELAKQVLAEVTNSDKSLELKKLKKVWRPASNPWFDKECQESFKNLEKAALEQNLDFSTDPRSFKRFRKRNKESCQKHFDLLVSKENSFKAKKAEKASRIESKPLKEEKSGLNDSPAVNKKIKFET